MLAGGLDAGQDGAELEHCVDAVAHDDGGAVAPPRLPAGACTVAGT
jgi:hypothetical protein